MNTASIYQRPYLESSFFIAFIKGEVTGGVDRGEIAQNIFDDAANGRWSIFTSTFTLAEVLKDRRRPQLSVTEEQRIDAFFQHEYIKLVTLGRDVAELARKLARAYGLRPADAVHLASAIKAKADELLTWDEGNFPINHTIEGVAIKLPYWFGQARMSILST